MYAILKNILKHSAAYSIGTVLNRAVGLLLLPLYTRYLTKADYGVLELLLVTSSIIGVILQLGMGSALFRTILYKENVDTRKAISTAFFALAGFAVLSIGILSLTADRLASLLMIGQDGGRLLRMLFVGNFFLLLTAIPMTVLRIKQRSLTFSAIAGGQFIFGLILNVLFLVVFKKGTMGILTANAIAAAISCLLYLLCIRNSIDWSFSLDELKDMLGFGLPLVPSAIAELALMMSDRYFINSYRGVEEVAMYSVALRLATVIAMAVSAFQMAWPAILFPLAKEADGPRIFSRLFNFYLFFLVTLMLGMSVFKYELFTLFAPREFATGASAFTLIMISFIFYGVYYFTSVGIQVKKKTLYFPLVLAIAAGLGIALNFLLIPGQGLMGAGYARAVSFAAMAVGIAVISERYYAIPYNYSRIVKLVAVAGFILLLNHWINFSSLFLTIAARFFILFLFPVLLYLWGFFETGTLLFVKQKLSAFTSAQHAES
ncbi:MAG TPA: oligosaccharide flippase family protein [bacterium]|nr:oligosaccharide flippase family protein [bacterium]